MRVLTRDAAALASLAPNNPPPAEVEAGDAAREPNAPLDPTTLPARRKPGVLSAITGFARPIVAGAMLAVIAGGSAMYGAPLESARIDPVGVEEPIEAAIYEDELAQFNRTIATLEAKHQRGEITADQLARARRLLHAVLIDHTEPATSIPRDHRGRIDVDGVVRAISNPEQRAATRGELVMNRLAADLERRMRVTARDMAHPESVVFIEGAPGYKALPESEVRGLVTEALKDIPLDELPGGIGVARLVRVLPNAGSLDAEHMSFRELQSALGDAQRSWLEEKMRPIIEGHELEFGLAAFGAVTAVRAASPEAAGLMDNLDPRFTIYRHTTDDGHFDTRARLAYRERRVLPDVDVSVTANTMITPRTTLRAGVTGTLALESAERLTGTATAGAHHTYGNWWFDTGAGYTPSLNRFETNMNAGYYDPDRRFSASTTFAGMFGPNVSTNGSSGRIAWEIDIAKDLRIGGAEGDLGVYAGVTADSNGDNADPRAGLFLRLRW